MITPWIGLALAAGMAAPELIGALSVSDYPDWALRQDASGAAMVEVHVDPRGKVTRCEVLDNFGPERFGTDVCRILRMKRVRPARDPAGNKAYGVVRTLLSMRIPDSEQGRVVASVEQTPDVVLQVTRLPDGLRTALTRVLLMVDEGGRAIGCAPARPTEPEAIANAVCAARASLGAKAVAGSDGRPVPHVLTRKVQLVVGNRPAEK